MIFMRCLLSCRGVGECQDSRLILGNNWSASQPALRMISPAAVEVGNTVWQQQEWEAATAWDRVGAGNFLLQKLGRVWIWAAGFEWQLSLLSHCLSDTSGSYQASVFTNLREHLYFEICVGKALWDFLNLFVGVCSSTPDSSCYKGKSGSA